MLLECMEAIGRGRLSERYVTGTRTEYVSGYIEQSTDGRDHVWINPAPEVVRALLHEMVHRVRPRWKERTVRRVTTALMRRLTDAEVQRIYEVYERRRRKVRTRRPRPALARAEGTVKKR